MLAGDEKVGPKILRAAHDRFLGIAREYLRGRVQASRGKLSRRALDQIRGTPRDLFDHFRREPWRLRIHNTDDFNRRLRGPRARGYFIDRGLTLRRMIYCEKNLHSVTILSVSRAASTMETYCRASGVISPGSAV